MGSASDRQLWLEEAWESWLRPVLLLALAGLGFAAYALGFISPLVTAELLGASLVLVGLVVNAAHTIRVASSPRSRVLAGAIGGVGAVLTVLMLWQLLLPGSPDVSGTLRKAGDVVTLGAAQGGRVVVEGTPHASLDKEARTTKFILALHGSGGYQSMTADFRAEDKRPQGPQQRGGQSGAFLGTSFELKPLGDDVTLRLQSIEPAGSMDLEVHVYRSALPIVWLGGALAVLALLSALLEAGLRPTVTNTYLTIGVASAAAFAFFARGGIAPRNAVMAFIGRALVSAIVGGIVGATLPPLLAWLRGRGADSTPS